MTDPLTTSQSIRYELLKLVPTIQEVYSVDSLIDNTEQLFKYIYEGAQSPDNKKHEIVLEEKTPNIACSPSRMGYGSESDIVGESSAILPWNTDEFKAEYDELQNTVTKLYLHGYKYQSDATKLAALKHNTKTEEFKEQEREALYTSFASGRQYLPQSHNRRTEGQYSIRPYDEVIRDKQDNLTADEKKKFEKVSREYFNRRLEFYKSDAYKEQEKRYAADPLVSLYTEQLKKGTPESINKISYFDQWSAERDAKLSAEKIEKANEIGPMRNAIYDDLSTNFRYITGSFSSSIDHISEGEINYNQTL
jgi:hypothetical protein